MSQKEISAVYDSDPVSKTASEFLQVIVKSKDRPKFLVQFKFKGSNVAHEQLVTRRQYLFLKAMTSIEFCKIVP